MRFLALKEGAQGNIDAKVAWLNEAASLGDSESMCELGYHAWGLNDLDAATDWYDKAAALGNTGAMRWLAARAREAGDTDTSRKWLQAASAQGDDVATGELEEHHNAP